MTDNPNSKPTLPTEALWKVGDTAEYLRLSPKAVYGLVERGELPCVRIGTRIRFVPKVVAAWVQQHQAHNDGLPATGSMVR